MNIPLHELKRMMEAAPKGPWHIGGCGDPNHVTGAGLTCIMLRTADGRAVKISDGPNGEFVAAAINALPSLIAAVEQARRVCQYDWSDNDSDAVADMAALHLALAPFQGKEKLP